MTRLLIYSTLVTTAFLCLPAMSFAIDDGSSPTFSSSKLKKVVVVGGTHGNEYTGVWCIKALDRAMDRIHCQYPSLRISTLLGNPRAHLENKRFVDQDLNRQFTREILLEKEVEEEEQNWPHELVRAREIDQILGPKFAAANGANGKEETHVVVDLHSTTSNMGLTIIVAEGDPIMTRAAAYVRYKCQSLGHAVNCILHTHPDRSMQPNLPSAGRHGFTIEVGPVPQGVLRHDAVEKTETAIHALLEYLHLYNTEEESVHQQLQEVYGAQQQQVKDEGTSSSFSSPLLGCVPCFRSLSAQKKGQMSNKIPWPSDEDNPNFPALMVHKELQDQDFTLIQTGDALFVDLDGNVIPYDGSHGSPIYLMFVNEGGYYYQSSGTGISVAVKAEYDLESGMLIEEEEFIQVTTKDYAMETDQEL